MAKAATQSQFEQVNALYEERQRFEAWLAALEAKRATTPVHIYTRVHADYSARLQRVVEELRTHRTALQELESTLIDRLTALDSEEAKHRDEAAEAELRATVGELAPEHFNEVTERTSGAIATLSEERGRVQAELARAATSARRRNGAASRHCGVAGATARGAGGCRKCRACASSTRARRRPQSNPDAATRAHARGLGALLRECAGRQSRAGAARVGSARGGEGAREGSQSAESVRRSRVSEDDGRSQHGRAHRRESRAVPPEPAAAPRPRPSRW